MRIMTSISTCENSSQVSNSNELGSSSKTSIVSDGNDPHISVDIYINKDCYLPPTDERFDIKNDKHKRLKNISHKSQCTIDKLREEIKNSLQEFFDSSIKHKYKDFSIFPYVNEDNIELENDSDIDIEIELMDGDNAIFKLRVVLHPKTTTNEDENKSIEITTPGNYNNNQNIIICKWKITCVHYKQPLTENKTSFSLDSKSLKSTSESETKDTNIGHSCTENTSMDLYLSQFEQSTPRSNSNVQIIEFDVNNISYDMFKVLIISAFDMPVNYDSNAFKNMQLRAHIHQLWNMNDNNGNVSAMNDSNIGEQESNTKYCYFNRDTFLHYIRSSFLRSNVMNIFVGWSASMPLIIDQNIDYIFNEENNYTIAIHMESFMNISDNNLFEYRFSIGNNDENCHFCCNEELFFRSFSLRNSFLDLSFNQIYSISVRALNIFGHSEWSQACSVSQKDDQKSYVFVVCAYNYIFC